MSNRRSVRLDSDASNASRDRPVGKMRTFQRSRLSKGPSLTVSLLVGGRVMSLETRELTTVVARSPAYACVSEGESCAAVGGCAPKRLTLSSCVSVGNEGSNFSRRSPRHVVEHGREIWGREDF